MKSTVRFWLLWICSLQIVGSACGTKTSTKEVLDADFLFRSLTPIDLLQPKDSAAVDSNTSYVWSMRTGVSQYVLEISDNIDFKNPIINKEISGTTYQVLPADISGGSSLPATKLYWRASAKSPTGNRLTSKAQIVFPVDSTSIYVNVNSSETAETGSKQAPFKSLGSAIAFAKSNGQSQVLVSAGTYNEDILMQPGVSVYGGYSATDWSRNVATNITNIVRMGITAVSVGNIAAGKAVVLDGVTITVGSANPAYGVVATNAHVTLRNNKFVIGDSPNGYGVYAITGSNLSLENNEFQITADTTGDIYGAYMRASTASVSGNTVTLTSNSGSKNFYGFYAKDMTSLTISNNTFNLTANTSMSAYGVYLAATTQHMSCACNGNTLTLNTNSSAQMFGFVSESATPTANLGGTMSNNTLQGTSNPGGGSAFGFSGTSGQSITYSQNTINLRNFDMAKGIVGSPGTSGVSLTLIDNTISLQATGDARAIEFNGSATLNAVTARNNSIYASGGSNGGSQNIGLRIAHTTTLASIADRNFISVSSPNTARPIEFNSAVTLTNNVIVAGGNSGTLIALSQATASNNTFVFTSSSGNISLASATMDVKFTNNIFVTSGPGVRTAMSEISAPQDPRSVENNAFWDMTGTGTIYRFLNWNTGSVCGASANCYVDATFESLTDWTGGTDKARNNVSLTNGPAANPFVNLPSLFTVATGGNSTTVNMNVAGNFVNGNKIEINRDGVLRTITAGGGTTSLTFTPALGAGIVEDGMEIRNWGAATSAVMDLRLSGTAPAALRTGGVDTSGNNCGAPGGGPGVGPGGESCGNVTVDRDGNPRTAGYSMGAYEF